MIRYRYIYEGDNPDLEISNDRHNFIPEKELKLYSIVNYAGHNWWIIELNNSRATLLAAKDDFGRHCFDDNDCDDYKPSSIREYLNQRILPELVSNGANPRPTNLYDVYGNRVADKVWLLSGDEAVKLPNMIRSFPNSWWLRSSADHVNFAAYVTYQGVVDSFGVNVDYNLAVRPAMKVDVDELR